MYLCKISTKRGGQRRKHNTISDSDPFDLLVNKGERFVRIQVKSTARPMRDSGTRYHFNITHRNSKKSDWNLFPVHKQGKLSEKKWLKKTDYFSCHKPEKGKGMLLWPKLHKFNLPKNNLSLPPPGYLR